MYKGILAVIKYDILEAAGALQLCVGQEAGSEAAIHAMRNVFQDGQSKAVLLVDATNAFNSLNRQAYHSCSSIALLWDVEERSNEEEEAKKVKRKHTQKSLKEREV